MATIYRLETWSGPGAYGDYPGKGQVTSGCADAENGHPTPNLEAQHFREQWSQEGWKWVAHFGFGSLDRYRAWFREPNREAAMKWGLVLSVLEVSDGAYFVGDRQAMYLPAEAVRAGRLTPCPGGEFPNSAISPRLSRRSRCPNMPISPEAGRCGARGSKPPR